MSELDILDQALQQLRAGKRVVVLTPAQLEGLDKNLTPEEAEPLFRNDREMYQDDDGVMYYNHPTKKGKRT